MATQERTFRWIEVVGAAAASAATSAVVVSWTLSATLQEIKTKQELKTVEQDRRIGALETTLQSTQSLDALQTQQLAVTDANYKNIIIALSEIKEQLRRR